MSFKLLQVHERFLKAHLHHVFCVGRVASESHGGTQHLRSMTVDQHFKCVIIPTFGRKNK